MKCPFHVLSASVFNEVLFSYFTLNVFNKYRSFAFKIQTRNYIIPVSFGKLYGETEICFPNAHLFTIIPFQHVHIAFYYILNQRRCFWNCSKYFSFVQKCFGKCNGKQPVWWFLHIALINRCWGASNVTNLLKKENKILATEILSTSVCMLLRLIIQSVSLKFCTKGCKAHNSYLIIEMASFV